MKSKIAIEIPVRKTVLKPVCCLRTVSKKWSDKFLKYVRKERGVYIFHKGMRVLYVGKTGRKQMTFGMRLRRHFQKKAANKRAWKRLKKHEPVEISFITADEICRRIKGVPINAKRPEDQAICLMEAALILVWRPEFQFPAAN